MDGQTVPTWLTKGSTRGGARTTYLGNVERERKVDVAPKGLRTLKLCPSIPYPERQVLAMRPAVSAAAVREDALPRGGNAHSQTSLPWATSGSPGSHLAQVTRFCGIFDLWLSFPVATSHRRTVLSREPLNSCSCVKSWTSLNVFQEHGVSENAPCAFPRHVPSRRANGGICTRLLLIDRDGLDCKLVSAEPLQRPRLSWSPLPSIPRSEDPNGACGSVRIIANPTDLADSRVPGSAERVPLSP